MKKTLLLTAVLAIGSLGLGCPAPEGDNTNLDNANIPAETPADTAPATPEPTVEDNTNTGDGPQNGNTNADDANTNAADGEKKDGEPAGDAAKNDI